MTKDLRFALRMISSHPWYSAAIVAALALGIGANTTVFTLFNAVLYKPVPVPGGERLVSVTNGNPSEDRSQMPVSYPDFLEYRSQGSAFEALEAAMLRGAVVSEPDNPPQRYRMGRITAGMFGMMHTVPALGRGFVPDDATPGAGLVVLLGHGMWMERYGGATDIVGRTIRVDGLPATVIGVMPEGIEFPAGQQLWMPLVPDEGLEDRRRRSLELFGMLHDGTTIEEARANLNVVAARLASEHPEANEGVGVNVQTFHERYNGGPIGTVFVLMQAAVGFVLLVACANVANMMLSRALNRRREVSIRTAMGASRWRIVRQLLTESVLLSFAGGVIGLGLTQLGIRAFDLAVANVGKPYWIHFTIDYTVFGYFAAMCLLSGLLFGLAPALQASRVDLNSALKDGTRTAGSVRGGRLSGALVVFQFMLAVVLLAGAGVFVRSYFTYEAINDWLPAESLLTAHIELPLDRYEDAEARQRFYDELLPRLRALPGVEQVAIVSNPPGTGSGERRFEIEGVPAVDDPDRPTANVVVQSPGEFRLVNLPILAGRDFEETDGTDSKRAAIVTRDFAERVWPGEDAIGKRVRFHGDDGPGEWVTVVGVSADVVQYLDVADPDPLLFLPYRQEGYSWMALMVRTAGEPTAVTGGVRHELQRLDPDLPLFDVLSMNEVERAQRWYLRVFGVVFLIFATIALLLASIGIYAVVAQTTGRRTQEIGVRMALGATSGSILRTVMARGMKQLAAGLALGLAGALAVTRLLTSMLTRVSPTDPVVFGAVTLVLLGIGMFACWLPARRAAALHPVKALRYE